MFARQIACELAQWKDKAGRKPLILRGARQTGKTTLIREFGRQFKNFIELNLEKDALRPLFSEVKDIRAIVQSIEGMMNKRLVPGDTLLFIDEIQHSPSAIQLLRYFCEEIPKLHVIAAGSLLEVRMQREGWSFPVGRVEFLYLYPASFDEFLDALGEVILLDQLKTAHWNRPLPESLHPRLTELLIDYIAIGGMPGAINCYLETRSLLSVNAYHDAITTSFKEDFGKYAKAAEADTLRFIWDTAPHQIGNRMHYSRLSNELNSAAHIRKAFDILHDAMLVERIWPTTSLTPPLVKKEKAAPKILFPDIGLCSHTLRLSRDQLKSKILSPVYEGALWEALAAQELLAFGTHHRDPLYFWIREEKGASAELDFLYPIGAGVVPIEVKAGPHGSLKSLHQFLFRSKTHLAIRIANTPLRRESHTVRLSSGEALDYTLLSIPPYLIFRLPQLIAETPAGKK